jgi:hypothetical protein
MKATGNLTAALWCILPALFFMTACANNNPGAPVIPDRLVRAAPEPAAPASPVTVEEDNRWSVRVLEWGRGCQADKSQIRKLLKKEN